MKLNNKNQIDLGQKKIDQTQQSKAQINTDFIGGDDVEEEKPKTQKILTAEELLIQKVTDVEKKRERPGFIGQYFFYIQLFLFLNYFVTLKV